nr:MAG TPA: hypothetical protein [Caudoviricetes sp.]
MHPLLQKFFIRARFMKYFIKMLPFFHVFHFHHFQKGEKRNGRKRILQ